MNFLNKMTIVAAVAIAALVGCEQEDQFIKRNTDTLNFSYNGSSETFTIRSTGRWYISDAPGTTEWTGVYDWVSVDKQTGVGDGQTYEQVTVTCTANLSDERTATIYLQGCGWTDVPILLTQEDGLFTFTTPLSISSNFKKGSESTSVLNIPYTKANGDEGFRIDATLTGGAGLTIEPDTYYVPNSGSGILQVPISGTPTTQGAVTFDLTATSVDNGRVSELGEIESIVRSGFDSNGDDIYLVYQDFSGLPWGGDCIGKKSGVLPRDVTIATLTIDAETEECDYTTRLPSGLCSTIRNNNVSLYMAGGMNGWYGYTNYMRPGYIELGADSENTLGQPGSLISPEFYVPSGVSDVLLTIKTAVWSTHLNKFEVGICTKVNGFYSTINQSYYEKYYVDAVQYRTVQDISDIIMDTWTDYSFVLPCSGLSSSKAYCVYVTFPEECWNPSGTIPAGRTYFDDIILLY